MEYGKRAHVLSVEGEESVENAVDRRQTDGQGADVGGGQHLALVIVSLGVGRRAERPAVLQTMVEWHGKIMHVEVDDVVPQGQNRYAIGQPCGNRRLALMCRKKYMTMEINSKGWNNPRKA